MQVTFSAGRHGSIPAAPCTRRCRSKAIPRAEADHRIPPGGKPSAAREAGPGARPPLRSAEAATGTQSQKLLGAGSSKKLPASHHRTRSCAGSGSCSSPSHSIAPDGAVRGFETFSTRRPRHRTDDHRRDSQGPGNRACPKERQTNELKAGPPGPSGRHRRLRLLHGRGSHAPGPSALPALLRHRVGDATGPNRRHRPPAYER